MFGIDSSELLVVALVALVVIGPKDLPRVMRMVGQWVAKGRAMSRHLRSGFDAMMREAELEEMQKAWAAQNDAIMKASAMPDFMATPVASSYVEPDAMLAIAAPEPEVVPPAAAAAAAPPAEAPAPRKPRSRAVARPDGEAMPPRKRAPRAKAGPNVETTE